MPQLSERAKKIPASPIRKLVPFADAAKKRGTHVYHLNIGQPDIETPPAYFEAIQQANIKVLAYTHSAGIEPLREEIISYYGRLGHQIDMSQVIVTTGASEALNFVFASCMNPGDEVIIPEPFYANYNSFSIFSNVKVVPITTDIEDNFALPPIEEFEKLITPKTKAILICNPGNPTGIMYPKESLDKLREIVLKHDLYLIADEVYREFAYDGLAHHSTLGLKGAEQNVIITDSISKRFSACGARIGCVVSRNAGIMDSVLKLAQARLSPPTFGQIGAQAVYNLPSSFYEGVVAEYVKRRDAMLRRLGEMDGVLCPQVNGAFYAMVRLPVDDSEKFCQWMLDEFSHKGATVMMAPGDGFYSTPGKGKDEVRIAYVLNQDDLLAAMECLEEGLKVYPGRTK
ncbi:MAG: pyridoxal phosphate-dependent aminotransferase [Bacteroidetes bacterium]|nr:pyridoxal phosphate-dependent aminotransferase [Bacteroidota bacterium]MCB0854358.1 pyridoxal phosphate-dependent aminotransferase [Bacteroidota bacterium]